MSVLDDPLPEDARTPLKVPMSESRVQLLAQELRGRDARVRVGSAPVQSGAFGAASHPWTLVVGSVQVAVPESAKATVEIQDVSVPGIQLSSDSEPAPGGFWLWVACEAVQHAHVTMEKLAAA